MGSIPLVALNVKPIDPIGQATGAMQLRALGQQTAQQTALAPGQVQQQQQQLKLGQQAIQQGQFAVQDREAGMKAMQQWDGKNQDEIPDLIQKNGGSLDSVLKARKSVIEAQQEKLALNDAQLANTKIKTDYLLGKLQAASGSDVPDDQLGQSVMKATQDSINAGYLDPDHAKEIQQYVQQYSDPKELRAHLAIYEKGLKSDSIQNTQLQKDREVTAQEQTAQARATAADTGAKRLDAEMPGGLLEPVDKAEMQAWLKKNPGKDAADYLAYKASLAPRAAIAAQGGEAGGLTPAALDQNAQRYADTGVMPPMGMGAAGAATRKAIMNRAAELAPHGSIAQNSAEYKANQASLTGLQKNFDQVTAFENTAGKNLDQFLSIANKVVDSGSPWINKPLRSVDAGGLGSADQAAFNAARQTAITEIAKVLNSSNASGVLSDSARGEVNELIGPNATLKQIVSASNILKKDMANRHDAYQQQISDIKGRLGGAQGGGQQQSSAFTKTISAAQVAKAAKDHGVSVEEATKQAKQAGYTIQ